MRNIFIFWIVFIHSFFPALAQVVNGGKIPGTYAPGLASEKNYVINGSCEKNATAGIAASGGSLTRGTTTPLNEDSGSECVIDASASGQTYTWSFNTFGERLKGGNCAVEFVYQGDASLYKAYVKNGTTQVTEDLTLTNVASGAKEEEINFPCGDLSASNTFVIEATDNAAAEISTIVNHVGKARNIGTVAQATHIGTLKYLGTTSCQWSSASTTLANFAADTDCPTPSVTGSVTAPGTKIPGAVLSNLAPGTYKVTVKTNVSKGGTVDAVVATAISDGTSTSAAQHTYANTTDGAYGFPITLVGYFTYTTSQSSVTFQVQGVTNSASNTVKVTANFASQADFEMAVEYFPSQSQTVVRMDQSDIGMHSDTCTSSHTTNTTTTCQWAREGENMRIQFKNAYAGAPTATSLTFTIPTAYAIDTAKLTSTVTYSKLTGAGGSLFKSPSAYNLVSLYNSTTVIAVGYISNGTTSAISLVTDVAPVTIASGDTVTLEALIPISGWTKNQNAPLLKGGVTSSSTGLERTERVRVSAACSSSPCTIADQSGSWVSSISWASTGQYTVNFTAGIFSSAPICTAICNGAVNVCVVSPGAVSTSSFAFTTLRSSTDAVQDSSFNIRCQGPR